MQDDDGKGIVLCCLGFVAIIVIGTLVLVATGAPAPLPRPAKARPVRYTHRVVEKDVEGRWLMDWGGGKWEAVFEQSGTYEARSGPSCYDGYWRIEGDYLVIVEGKVNLNTGERGEQSRYRILFSRDDRGRINLDKMSGNFVSGDGTKGNVFGLVRPARRKP